MLIVMPVCSCVISNRLEESLAVAAEHRTASLSSSCAAVLMFHCGFMVLHTPTPTDKQGGRV